MNEALAAVRTAASAKEQAKAFTALEVLMRPAVAVAWKHNARSYRNAGLTRTDFTADAFLVLHKAARNYRADAEASFSTYYIQAVLRYTVRQAQREIATGRGLTHYWKLNPKAAPNKMTSIDEAVLPPTPAHSTATASAAAAAIRKTVSGMSGHRRVVADELLQGRKRKLATIARELGLTPSRVSSIYREVLAEILRNPEVECLDIPNKAHWAS